MFSDPQGPIEHFSWGKFVICGRVHSDSDAEQIGAGENICLIGQEVTEWTERKGHQLTYSMIPEIFHRGIEVLILGTGVHGAIDCPAQVLQEIRASGIPQVILAQTPEACEQYNHLFHEGKKVALLAHGTC